MGLESILNRVKVSERIETSGQPQDGEFGLISRAGFDSVINLAMANSEGAIPEEGNIVSAYGMNYFHIPVDFGAPTRAQLVLFLNLMQICSNHKIWVHCALNYRASAFIFHYLKSIEGWSEEHARAAMFQTWQPDAVWQDFLKLEITQ